MTLRAVRWEHLWKFEKCCSEIEVILFRSGNIIVDKDN